MDNTKCKVGLGARIGGLGFGSMPLNTEQTSASDCPEHVKAFRRNQFRNEMMQTVVTGLHENWDKTAMVSDKYNYPEDEEDYVQNSPYKKKSVIGNTVQGLAGGTVLGGYVGGGLGAMLGGHRHAANGAIIGGVGSGLLLGAAMGSHAYKANKKYLNNPEAVKEMRRHEFKEWVLPNMQMDEDDFMDAVEDNPTYYANKNIPYNASAEEIRRARANIQEHNKIMKMDPAAYSAYMQAARDEYRRLDPKLRNLAYTEVVHNGMPFTVKSAGVQRLPKSVVGTKKPSIPGWKSNAALGMAGAGALIGYNTSSDDNKGLGAMAGGAMGMALGSAYRKPITRAFNDTRKTFNNMDASKLNNTKQNNFGNGRSTNSFKKVQYDKDGNPIPWNSSKGW